MNANPETPAAQGIVRVSTGANGNTHLGVKVMHMASPEKITRGAATYVVWVSPETQPGMHSNVGALRVGKELAGELNTVTPLQNFRVTVTAEPSPIVTQPTGEAILSTRVVRE